MADYSEVVRHGLLFGEECLYDGLSEERAAQVRAEIALARAQAGKKPSAKLSRNRRTTVDLRAQVIALRERGMVPTAIANVLNLPDRRVRHLLNEARKANAGAKKNAT